MIFWDTSAIVPLLLDEPASSETRELARRDPAILVWWATEVECRSAIARRRRADAVPIEHADEVLGRLKLLQGSWHEVAPVQEVRSHAGRLLRRHPLRAADALQLGAALTWAAARPEGHGFATLDRRLAMAARGEGFDLALAVALRA